MTPISIEKSYLYKQLSFNVRIGIISQMIFFTIYRNNVNMSTFIFSGEITTVICRSHWL